MTFGDEQCSKSKVKSSNDISQINCKYINKYTRVNKKNTKKVKSSNDILQNISKYINTYTSVNQKYEDFSLSYVTSNLSLTSYYYSI